ncbi:hypothetical protein ACFC63_18035 [Streptomyces albidoflavus]
MSSVPLAAAALHTAVMRAAEYRCQCTGRCGNAHRKGGGRCPLVHDGYTSKRGRRVHLAAAPPDPLTPLVQAVSLSAADLMAWCPDCHTGALRQARKDARRPDPDQGALFD